MGDQNISVYEPNQRLKEGWIGTWVKMFKNVIAARDLIIVLYRRDLISGYKKSWIGWIWIFISPIIGIVSWVFMNSTGILNPGDVGIPYPAYVLLSSSVWGLFMGFYGSAAGTLGAGGEFINQIKYPHEVLLVKQVALHITNFLITFLINIIVLLLFGVTPSPLILLFPFLALPLFLLGSAIGLVISVISIVASDLTNIFNILFGFVFYITPVIYSDNIESELLRTVIKFNPLTYLVGGVRDAIIYGRIDHLDYFLIFSFISLILFLLSLRLFYVAEDRVVEKMI